MPLRPQRPIDPDRAFGRASGFGTALAAVLAAVAGASAALGAAPHDATNQGALLCASLGTGLVSALMVRRVARSRGAVARRHGELAAVAEAARERSEETAEALISLPQGIATFDAEGRLRLANDRFAAILGLDSGTVRPGTHASEIAAFCGVPSAQALLEAGLVTTLATGTAVQLSVSRTKRGGTVVLAEDATARTEAERRIRRLAQTDGLTELPNRTAFLAGVDREIEGCTPFALLCIDLDRFKEVNDTLGHPVGDALLREVSGRLRGLLRADDVAARFGGDEFVVLQRNASDVREAAALAMRIVDAIGKPFRVEGHRIDIGASVGIACSPIDGNVRDELHRKADLALYRAKAAGRGTWRSFDQSMDEEIRRRHAVETAMRRAILRKEFAIHYQPIVDAGTGRRTSMEALVRWTNGDGTPMPASAFLGIAEETGLIVPIGRWVLEEACREAAAWRSDLRVAVNVSSRHARRADFAEEVLAVLRSTGLPPRRLEIEIAESLFDGPDHELAVEALLRLRTMGVRIVLDDFGSGCSRLADLRRFPFDRIKIAGNLVGEIAGDDGAVALVRSVLSLGQALGARVTVEGVETPEQVRRLMAEGCSEMQGYAFGRPMPADAIADLRTPPEPLRLSA